MPVTPKEILSVAEDLGSGSTEVAWRSAASRAYYALFHRCVPIGASLGVNPDDPNVHGRLIAALTDSLVLNRVRSLGFMLRQCRSSRVMADYKIHDEYAKDDWDSALETCRRAIAKAESIDP